jgi:SAM-dependent methyltransferase
MTTTRTLALIVGVAIVAALAAFQLGRSVSEPKPGEAAVARPWGAMVQLEADKAFIPTLNAQLQILDRWRLHDREVEYRTPFYFLWVAGLFKQYAVARYASLKDLTIVEIGPGSGMITGALYVSALAKRYYGVDIYENPRLRDALPYRVAFRLAYIDPDYLARDPSEIILKEEGGKVVFNPERITFLKRQSYDTGLPDDSVDYVFSMATIEHIDEPEKSILEWKRVLKPGGISAHHAALADHRDFTRPYEYLKLDQAAWRAQFVGPAAKYPAHDYVNPWRPIDFKRAFEKAGFEILEYSTELRHPFIKEQARVLYPNRTLSDADWAQITPSVREGRTREEVSELFITIVVRKPAK